MAGRPARKLEISDDERRELRRWLGSQQKSAAEKVRASIILLSAQALSMEEICRLTGVTAQIAGKWRSRFATKGIAGLAGPLRRKRARIEKIAVQPVDTTHWATVWRNKSE